MIHYDKLDTEYDQVVFLDFLSDQERNKHHITSEIVDLFQKNNIGARSEYLSNSSDLTNILESLKTQANSGYKVMLHFIAHGNESGVGFKHTGEFISWEDLENALTELNKATDNTLVLNLTSCFGLHGIKTVNPFSSDNPFFGLIGYTKKLNIKLSKSVNNQFYSSIFNGAPFNEAIKQLQRSTGDLGFQCITSQGYSYIKNKKK
jgi:hypothetical protein